MFKSRTDLLESKNENKKESKEKVRPLSKCSKTPEYSRSQRSERIKEFFKRKSEKNVASKVNLADFMP